MGKSLSLINYSALNTNSVGTIYAIKGVKKDTVHRDSSIMVTNLGISNTSVSDAGLLMLVVNPTLSAPLTYVANSTVLDGTPGSAITVTPGTGRIVHVIPSGVTGSGIGLNDSFLSMIGMSIANVSDEYILAYMPATSNQSVFGAITIKEVL